MKSLVVAVAVLVAVGCADSQRAGQGIPLEPDQLPAD